MNHFKTLADIEKNNSTNEISHQEGPGNNRYTFSLNIENCSKGRYV